MNKRKTTSVIPRQYAMKKPLLELLQKKGEISLDEAIQHIAKVFSLSPEAIRRKQPCGKEPVLQNRVRWARWDLKCRGIVETTRRGYFRLTKAE